ncbi:MAG: hypothetical protein JSS82_13680 [Bacteroidetes bacterium]|nr:hypothetical protein [Bacteroidota bacterium]
MKLLLPIMAACLLFAGCIKTDLKGLDQDYQHGRLLLEFDDTTHLQTAANICFENGTPIVKAVGFSFISSIPIDSLQALRSVLLSKSYVDASSVDRSLIASSPNKILIDGLILKNLNEQNFMDFKGLEESVNLTEYTYKGGTYPNCRSMLVQVPDSNEAKYAWIFYEYKFIKRIGLYNANMEK